MAHAPLPIAPRSFGETMRTFYSQVPGIENLRIIVYGRDDLSQILARGLWEKVRALGELQGQHVFHGIGKTRLCDQADELSGAHSGIQV